ncbi:MAG: YceI family protein [Saprospiraceae bacterium]|nr:YceI family protein [Saprospiraceae bacterium]
MQQKQIPIILFLFFCILNSLFINAQNGKYHIDNNKSEIEWTGYHAAKSFEHWGSIKTSSGFVTFENGNISGGEVNIDMNSIKNIDLKNDSDKNKLIRHLKSEEFFNVSKFPEAQLTVKKSELVRKGVFNITADITLKGIKKEITFGATCVSTYENGYKITAELTINRIMHDIMFGWSIEDAMIDKDINLDIMLIIKQDDHLLVDTENSVVEWTGYHPGKLYEHWGTLKVKTGYIDFKDGNIISGEIIIDMKSLENTDLTTSSDKKKLEDHLKSNSFFDVHNFPEASLKITSAENTKVGLIKITADITIKEVTKEITFEAKNTSTYDNCIKFKTDFKINRLDHNITFGWDIEDAMIDKEIQLDVLLICK